MIQTICGTKRGIIGARPTPTPNPTGHISIGKEPRPKIFPLKSSFLTLNDHLTIFFEFFRKLRCSVARILVFEVVDIAGIYTGIRPLVGGRI